MVQSCQSKQIVAQTGNSFCDFKNIVNLKEGPVLSQLNTSTPSRFVLIFFYVITGHSGARFL